MLTIKSEIAQNIAQTIQTINSEANLDAESILGMFEYPPDEKMGDIALPCFKLSKALRMSPIKIAETVAAAFSAEHSFMLHSVIFLIPIKYAFP